MAVEMRALLEEARGPLPPRPERWRVGELVLWSKAEAPELEQALWQVALGHERRAMDAASLEPGALDAVTGARDAGFRTALWTNNARALTVPAPAHFTARLAGGTASARTAPEVVVGDSWVDGVAAAAVGVPFVAYRAREEELRRWGVEPVARLDDLAALPAWLMAQLDGHATR